MFLLQLEVLELLVHYGADLNVRNKHDETPAGFYFVITITNKQTRVYFLCVRGCVKCVKHEALTLIFMLNIKINQIGTS